MSFPFNSGSLLLYQDPDLDVDTLVRSCEEYTIEYIHSIVNVETELFDKISVL